jgi:hypothetical protein
MDILVGLLLLAAVLAALAYPLFRARPRAIANSGGALGELQAQRDGLYATLHDLDLDFELGKLNGSDYQARREKYLGRASAVLQQLDHASAPASQDLSSSDEIEREVEALRGLAGEATGETAFACPNCGRVYNQDDRFCGRCGQTLT